MNYFLSINRFIHRNKLTMIIIKTQLSCVRIAIHRSSGFLIQLNFYALFKIAILIHENICSICRNIRIQDNIFSFFCSFSNISPNTSKHSFSIKSSPSQPSIIHKSGASAIHLTNSCPNSHMSQLLCSGMFRNMNTKFITK